MARAKAKTVIHVNRQVINRNQKTGRCQPPLTVKDKGGRGKAVYAMEVIIRDEYGNEVARVRYRPRKPLSCGAKCWVECTYPPILLNDTE